MLLLPYLIQSWFEEPLLFDGPLGQALESFLVDLIFD